MAYAMTVLAWGLIDYEDAYIKAGELENGRKAIKWGTDYFIKVSLILKYFLIAFMYYFLQILSVTQKIKNFMDKWAKEV
jgi:hypothetical protein